jgi:anti-sigma factor RsiW
MTCKRAHAFISLYIDDRLDPAGQARLNTHLSACADCAAYLRDLQAGLSALRAEPLAEPSINFDWNLRRKLQQAQLEGWRFAQEEAGGGFWPRFLLSAAAALILALGGGYTAYRFAQAPAVAPLAIAPTVGNPVDKGLGIPETPQPFPGALNEQQPGFQTVGGVDRAGAAASERGAIQAADPLRPLALRADSGRNDSLAAAPRADSLR